MRFGICAPFREVATLEMYPFDYLEENVQRFLMPECSQAEFEELWQEARRLPVQSRLQTACFSLICAW